MDLDADDYDAWNKIKKGLSSNPESTVTIYPKAGEVWMSLVGKNIGFEQNGSGTNFSRPVLILKKFNNKMFWSIPLSTKQKKIDFYYNFADPDNRKVSLIIAQLKLLSVKRLRRKMYAIPQVDFINIVEKVKNLLQ